MAAENCCNATVRLKYSFSMRSKAVATSKRVQYAALPYRRTGAADPEVMLVTSRGRQRWIIPKGWPHGGRAPCDSAAREAFEEAGILGEVGRRSGGHFVTRNGSRKGGSQFVTCTSFR
jgi:8-oxo-dGTP pyrophosphatase MutT (NUDIX family)